ncbi:MAG: PTS mannitol transporter subunit IIABC [Acidobacteria bacterium]|nr:PTS mannitol transporter subunit IIABC [Acidobacteriota bacterium]
MSRYLFVTGKLAGPFLQKTLEGMGRGLKYECAVLPISVAALMDARFVAKHLTSAMGCDKVMIPGLCSADPGIIEDKLGVEVICGPRCLKDIPGYFGKARALEGYGAHKVRIFAEIVDAYRLGMEAIMERASYYRANGADVIDLGCPVEGGFPNIDRVVKALKSDGYLVSVDSFSKEDILKADEAHVDFLLSVNSRNMEVVPRLHCKVVVVPDFEQGLESLERNISQLEAWGVPYIIDPVLRPIGFGFTESIGEFITTRRNHPKAEMLLGSGNLTELTDADTTGMSAVMAGVVTELEIDYVLTTEVISWARGAVREFDVARRLMHYACHHRILPKHLDDGLITIKDPPFEAFSEEELRGMQEKVRDRNYRIFIDRDSVYVFNNKIFIRDNDVQSIFNHLNIRNAAEAFYLGRELQKASLALKLGKKYEQEEDLRWGYLSE